MSLFRKIRKHASNVAGWRTDRKIIIIESDDWGSIRMPSNEVHNTLTRLGIDLISGDSYRYNKYDSLESPDDLASLFEVLTSVKDITGRFAVMTAVSVVANPDFIKIKENGFREYYYEPFTKTLNRYYQNNKSFKLWEDGIRNKIFVPQFHGREHLNVSEWMRALQKEDKHTRKVFDHGLWGFKRRPAEVSHISFQAPFDFYDPNDLFEQNRSIKEGLKLFNELFGYKASFFVPANGPFNTSLEKTACESGIKYMSVSKIQSEPLGFGKSRKIFHWLGQQNKYGQRYLVRNCFFEPSQIGKDWVYSCLRDISIALSWCKPAIICTHRLNYIGALNSKNRDNGLYNLGLLLTSILKKWPDVEFMTSDELGNLIESGL